MKRTILSDLAQWKNSENRKPLILWGARQVGKTWLMKEFGKTCFENFVYISFYNNPRIKNFFEEDYNPARIIQSLEIELHVKIQKQNTLIIFDEVQNAPKVLESLKYFCEEASEYAIVCAGSLLGVAIHEGVSFPVGKVNEIRLYPLSFQEFLLAMEEEQLASFITDCKNPEVNSFREKYIQLLKTYYFVGGMPEAVESFRVHKNFSKVREIQNDILSQYEGDFGKHIPPQDLPRIKMVWNAIPLQLAKENRKFFFGQIKTGARMKDFELSIQWLVDCGLVHKVHKVSKPALPLIAYIDFTSFKLYRLDVGLLGAMTQLDETTLLNDEGIFEEFKGALTEQYVAQELFAQDKIIPYYYSGEKSTYEVDFVIQRQSAVIPLEVKAKENLKSKSLKFYVDKFKPSIAYRTSMSNYKKQDWLINIPLWSIMGID